jgi:hypothetical protein
MAIRSAIIFVLAIGASSKFLSTPQLQHQGKIVAPADRAKIRLIEARLRIAKQAIDKATAIEHPEKVEKTETKADTVATNTAKLENKVASQPSATAANVEKTVTKVAEVPTTAAMSRRLHPRQRARLQPCQQRPKRQPK